MQRLGEIESAEEKIHARARKVLYSKGNFVWARGRGQREIRGSHKKFSGGERGAKRRMRLFRARGSAELGKVVSGFDTQNL